MLLAMFALSLTHSSTTTGGDSPHLAAERETWETLIKSQNLGNDGEHLRLQLPDAIRKRGASMLIDVEKNYQAMKMLESNHSKR